MQCCEFEKSCFKLGLSVQSGQCRKLHNDSSSGIQAAKVEPASLTLQLEITSVAAETRAPLTRCVGCSAQRPVGTACWYCLLALSVGTVGWTRLRRRSRCGRFISRFHVFQLYVEHCAQGIGSSSEKYSSIQTGRDAEQRSHRVYESLAPLVAGTSRIAAIT